MPLLVRVDPHDLVAEVLVLAADVRVRVVDVVVGVLPRLRGRRRVPVPGRGVDLPGRSSSPTGRAGRCGRSPCSRGSWPASSRSVPATHAGLNVEAQQQRAAEHGEPPVHLDHRHDVAAVAVAEVVVDLVVDRVELAPSSSICSALRCASGLSISSATAMCSPRAQSSISTRPSGALMQVRTISPSEPVIWPLRRSRTRPEQSFPMQVWQIPSRQPNGSSSPASSPATRIGVAAVALDLACRSWRRRSCRPRPPRRARAWAGSAPCAGGRSRPRAPSARSARRAARRGRRRTPRARASRGTARRGRRASSRGRSPVSHSVRRRRPSWRSSSARSSPPKMTSSSVRAEWMWTTSVSASRAARLRSMLMIGVMPLPALMNSSFSGELVGQHEVALDAAEPDHRARLRLAHEVGRRPCRPRRASA